MPPFSLAADLEASVLGAPELAAAAERIIASARADSRDWRCVGGFMHYSATITSAGILIHVNCGTRTGLAGKGVLLRYQYVGKGKRPQIPIKFGYFATNAKPLLSLYSLSCLFSTEFSLGKQLKENPVSPCSKNKKSNKPA
jgi:hypothetical protein